MTDKDATGAESRGSRDHEHDDGSESWAPDLRARMLAMFTLHCRQSTEELADEVETLKRITLTDIVNDDDCFTLSGALSDLLLDAHSLGVAETLLALCAFEDDDALGARVVSPGPGDVDWLDQGAIVFGPGGPDSGQYAIVPADRDGVVRLAAFDEGTETETE